MRRILGLADLVLFGTALLSIAVADVRTSFGVCALRLKLIVPVFAK
jgi:hypothetical protein